MIALSLRWLYVHNVSLLVPSFILHIEIWTEGPILCTRQFPIICVYLLCISILISPWVFLIDNKPLLCQLIVWHRIVVKPLTEAMMSRFIDAYIDGLVPDCSIYIANSPEIMQSRHRCVPPGPIDFSIQIEHIVSHNNMIVLSKLSLDS